MQGSNLETNRKRNKTDAPWRLHESDYYPRITVKLKHYLVMYGTSVWKTMYIDSFFTNCVAENNLFSKNLLNLEEEKSINMSRLSAMQQPGWKCFYFSCRNLGEKFSQNKNWPLGFLLQFNYGKQLKSMFASFDLNHFNKVLKLRINVLMQYLKDQELALS